MNAPRSARSRAAGFTLIELLTVIAIIGILAGLIAAGLPRALERAKIANLQGTFQALKNSLATYYADHGTYPPRYGYIEKEVFGQGLDPATIASNANNFVTWSYLGLLKQPLNQDLYDNFSLGPDANRNGQLSLAEYYPIPQVPVGGGNPQFQNCVYTLFAGCDQTPLLMNEESRPLLYFPVNKRQVQLATQHWVNTAENAGQDVSQPFNLVPWELGPQAFSIFNPGSGLPNEISFPPNQYDAYVLISVGPSGSTFGIVPEDGQLPNNVPPAYRYHVMGLMAYFMATRDIDNDGALDFDFLARTRGGEGDDPINDLPDPLAPRGTGPMIFKGE